MDQEIDYTKYIIKDFIYWRVYLHMSQIYLGRCYIALKRDGNLDPYTDTTEAERTELQSIIVKIQQALIKLYQPDMFNYANLRNVWHHCHWHIIPRYKEQRVMNGQRFVDENWGKNYAPIRSDFHASDQLLNKMKTDLLVLLNE